MLNNALTKQLQPIYELVRVARYPDIVVTIKPFGSNGMFSVKHAGRRLVRASRTPFLNAARKLIEEGWPPGSILAMRHWGQPGFALKGKLGQVAKLTIEEGNRPPTVRLWKASPYAAVESPMRFLSPLVPTPRPRARKRYRARVHTDAVMRTGGER